MKMRMQSGLGWGIAAFLALSAALSAQAQKVADRDMRTRGRQNYDVVVGDVYTGRSPYFRGTEPQVAQAKPAAPAKPAVPCSTATTGLVSLGKTAPSDASLGEPFTYELKALASGCAGNVVVTDTLPEGVSLVSSQPEASVNGRNLTWNLGNLDAGESKTIKVTVKPEKEGTLTSCATIKADPRVCSQTVVGKPQLAIDKTGPEIAQLGADVDYNVTVKNVGSAVAKGVVVTDKVPAGLGGGEKTFQVGDLAPGQARTIPVKAKAAERGRHCNVAVASSSNAGTVQDDACTTVVKPGLKLAKSGDDKRFINKQASYKIVASNTGDTELTGVVVTDTAPPQTKIVSAPGASVAGNTATWNVGSLKPGDKKEFAVVLTSTQAGRWCNVASVNSTQGLRETAEACTTWIGVSAVLVEVVDDPDPIQIGESTTYTIRITNQGNADLTNIKSSAEFKAEVTPVSSQGGTVSGKSVSFPTIPRLGAKQAVTYTITAKGAGEGDHRLIVKVQPDGWEAPVTEEESTRVY
ncbi:MAG: 60 kDa cysteine-rich outer membrane protein [Verrucomicrobiota bacterium]